MRPKAPAKSETFLADAVGRRPGPVGIGSRRLTYGDGMRFGIGFIVANLLILSITGGLAWGIMLVLAKH